MKFKMHCAMVIVMIFTMISSSTAAFMKSLCFGGGEQSCKEEASPPTQPSSPQLSPSSQPQSVRIPNDLLTYEEICENFVAPIPSTRNRMTVDENGPTEKAKDGNIAVCAKKTQFKNYMGDKYDMRRNDKGISLFALYDGHGGANVAECAANNLLNNIMNNIEKSILNQQDENYYKKLLKLEIMKFDENLKHVYDWESSLIHQIKHSWGPFYDEEEDEKQNMIRITGSGSTALIGLIDENTKILYVANLGNSHGEMCCESNGTPIKLSKDFDLINRPEEKDRIKNAGGIIEEIKINNNHEVEKVFVAEEKKSLSFTRAIGDYGFKKNYENPVVSYEPEVLDFPLSEHSKYILFATDGGWPRTEDGNVDVKTAFEKIDEKYTPTDYYGTHNLCTYVEKFMNEDNGDNITVMVVNLQDIKEEKKVV